MKVYAEPSASNIIDTINEKTGLTTCYGETLEQVRERYPTAQAYDFDEWRAEQGKRQHAPIEWVDTDAETFDYMLEVLPPACMMFGHFLVGEPVDHDMTTGAPRYDAYGQVGEAYRRSSRPMTRKEFRALFA